MDLSEVYKWLEKDVALNSRALRCSPYRYPDGTIVLQMDGWAIILKDDGTWHCEDTVGL